MKNISKLLSKNLTVVICLTTVFLFLTQEIKACSSDALIWQNSSENAYPLYRFMKGEKSGYIDQTGKIVIDPTLDFYGNSGGEFINGLLLIDDGKFIDTTGKIVINKDYYRTWEFSDGLAVTMREDNGKWGYIDKTGEFIISPKFEGSPNGYVYPFSDGLAMIDVKKSYGYVNRSGEFVIQPKFLKGTGFNEGLARVVVEGPCLYIGDGVCAPFNARVIPEGADAKETSLCKFAFIDKSGTIISKDRFERANDFSEGLAAILKDGKWGFIDKQGKVIIEPQFDDAASFSEGLASVQKNKLWGYINKSGKFAISPQFKFAGSFADGLAPIANWNEQESDYDDYYYINKNGKQAFAGKFNVASHYFKGLAHVKLSKIKDDDYYLNGKYAYINIKGEKVFTYERTSNDD